MSSTNFGKRTTLKSREKDWKEFRRWGKKYPARKLSAQAALKLIGEWVDFYFHRHARFKLHSHSAMDVRGIERMHDMLSQLRSTR